MFIRDAVQGNLAEIKLGQLAQEKTQSAEVKSYAQMLVTDHSTSNEQAEKVAKQIGITIPTELSVSQKVTYNRMSKLSGTAFDRAFVAEMIAGRKTSITRFQNEAKKNDDPAGDFATDAADFEEASRRGTAAGTGFMSSRVRYAEHCLKMVPLAPDQEYRNVQREMAAEWLKLADAVLHPLKRIT